MSQATNRTGETEAGAAGAPTYKPGQRAPAFDSMTAAYMGARGGVASGAARRKKKAMRELAQMILDKKVTDDEINNRLRSLGILPEEKSGSKEPRRATVGMAILGHMADLAMMHRDEKEAAASVKAGETLIRIASGEIGLPPEVLHGQDGEAPGGVVLMPAVDPGMMDGMPVGDQEQEAGEAEKSQADGISESGKVQGGAL